MYKTRSKQGSEDKWGDCSVVSKTIVKQVIKVILGYCANGPMGVSSPMSKTRPKRGIEDKRRDIYNVSKTILKKGIDGPVGSNQGSLQNPPLIALGHRAIRELPRCTVRG